MNGKLFIQSGRSDNGLLCNVGAAADGSHMENIVTLHCTDNAQS